MSQNTRRILTEGLFAGMLGYLAVVVVIGAIDVIGGRSAFHTAAVLGSVLFFGVRDPAQLTVWAGPVFAYNGAHMLVFLLFGGFMAWLTSLAEKGEQMWYVSLITLLIVLPHVIGLPVWFDVTIGQVLSLWSVVIATTAAAIAMAAYLWHAHPRLHREITARTV